MRDKDGCGAVRGQPALKNITSAVPKHCAAYPSPLSPLYSRRAQAISSAVPVQYFQSIIAIQLAVAGALLFQVRFFDNWNTKSGPQVDPRLRLVVVVVIAATLFASLEATQQGWGPPAAALVTAGLALSCFPSCFGSCHR